MPSSTAFFEQHAFGQQRIARFLEQRAALAGELRSEGHEERSRVERRLTDVDQRVELHRYMLLSAEATITESRADFAKALELHDRACGQWEAFSNVVEHTHALAGAGRCLVALGRRTEGTARLEAAGEVYASLAARPLVAGVSAALESVA